MKTLGILTLWSGKRAVNGKEPGGKVFEGTRYQRNV